MPSSRFGVNAVVAQAIAIVLLVMSAGGALRLTAYRSETRAFDLGTAALRSGDWSEADSYFTRSLQVRLPVSSEAHRIQAFLGRSLARYFLGDQEAAALDIAQAESIGASEVEAAPYRAAVYFANGDNQAGLDAFGRSILERPDLPEEAQAEIRALAALANFVLGREPVALALAEKTLENADLLTVTRADGLYAAILGHFMRTDDGSGARPFAELGRAANPALAAPYAVLAYLAYLESDGERTETQMREALLRDPGNLLARLLSGSLHAWAYDLPAALTDLDAVLAVMPENPHALAVRAFVYLALDDPASAEADVAAIPLREAENPFAIWARALIATRRLDADAVRLANLAVERLPGRPEFLIARALAIPTFAAQQERSVEDVDAALALDPDFFYGLSARGVLAGERGDLTLLRELGDQLVLGWPQAPDGYLLLALTAEREYDPDASLAFANQAVSAAPWSARALLARAAAFQNLELFTEAEADIAAAAARLSDGDTDVLFAEAAYAAARYDYTRAIDTLEGVIEMAPLDRSAWLALSEIYFAVDDLSAAWEALSIARGIDPDWPPLHYQQARLYAAGGEAGLALDVIKTADKTALGIARIQTLEAGILLKQGQGTRAAISARRALSANPGEVGALLVLAEVQLEEGNFAASLEILDTALSYKMLDAQVHALRSRVLFIQHQDQEALVSADEALRLDNAPADFYILRAQLRTRLGDLGGASEDASAAIERSYDPRQKEDLSAYLDFLNWVPPVEDGARFLAGRAGATDWSIVVPERWTVTQPGEGELSVAILYISRETGFAELELYIGQDLLIRRVEELVDLVAFRVERQLDLDWEEEIFPVELGALPGFARALPAGQPLSGQHYYFFVNGSVIFIEFRTDLEDYNDLLADVEQMIGSIGIIQ